jgi:hypothetical protein
MSGKPLDAPPVAAADSQSYELLRLWMAGDGTQEIVVRTVAELEPGHWGILLVDAAKHIALAHAHGGRGNATENFLQIIAAVIGEIQGPPDAGDSSAGGGMLVS